ncbi:MAG: hypothetical protein JO290_01680 [Sphingomonadaceae bacterium]|nr:hypothetical protein [Sphingomonadaceae bacterium]
MKLTLPGSGGVVRIAPSGDLPPLPFATDARGPHAWDWRLAWRDHVASGTAATADGRWDARAAIGCGGGTLTVRVAAGSARCEGTVELRGSNPTTEQVAAYLAGKPDAAGFDRIVAHESRCRHFAADGVPIVSFDGGVGLCQLTNPPPTVAQTWDWRANLDAGLALFRQKRAAAGHRLGQGGRHFTPAQATREAVCLWNGGPYHVWDGSRWVRPATIVCDPLAGNIGWDMTDPANHGRTPAALHARDVASYARGHGAHWHYSGVCYADHLLGDGSIAPDDGRLRLGGRR